ncbi:transporter substrate-binding domain-containing protein [uncultured Lacticaseibacillus sp.]|uniref:transporter substrate-binding domain-containing protein n=1 Tax=uncultured Lacticaseibacillus sp. TaxID=2775882 RepID=UPI00259170F7|nr:transporter substrate-binding domain-containing protein [uncultured Lacticaseibacillus sp.]
MKFNWKKIAVVTATVAGALTLATFGQTGTTHAASNYKSELVHKGELTIGLEGTYKPWSYRKDGKLTGFEVDLGKAIAKKLGVKANFVPTKWDSLIAGLGSGKFDTVLNDVTPTPERRKAYAFSTPYVYSRYALITKSGSKLTTLKSVKGKKLVEGTGTDNADVAKKAGANITWNGEFATTLQMIKQGRADGTINSTPTWYAYKQDNATKGLKATVLKNSEVKPAKVSALLDKKDKNLQKRVNSAIKALKKDGTLKKLSKKYFGADITK